MPARNEPSRKHPYTAEKFTSKRGLQHKYKRKESKHSRAAAKK